MANKDKKNKTSFDFGNTVAEKWTFEQSEEFFNNAYELSKKEISLTDISNILNLYPNIFTYLVEKYPVFITIKENICKQIENNIVKGAMKGDYNPTITIFNLKNNHNWKDKTEIDQKNTHEFKGDPFAQIRKNAGIKEEKSK